MGLTNRIENARAIEAAHRAGTGVALATVVATTGSAPRGVGAQVALVDGQRSWTGGISGGCAEAEVIGVLRDLAARPIDENGPLAITVILERTGPESTGPQCGSTLTVLVEQVDSHLASLMSGAIDLLTAGEAVTIERTYCPSGDGALHRTSLGARRDESLADSHADFLEWAPDTSLVEHLARVPHLALCGGGDVAAALIRLARQTGWRTTLLEPRRWWVVATTDRADIDAVIERWPGDGFDDCQVDSRTACVAAAHEERLDVPFLQRALVSDAFYVGAIGSRSTQVERRELLADLVDTQTLDRLHGPAGIDLGGSDASEIALSVMAEILAALHGRSAQPLTATSGPIRAT